MTATKAPTKEFRHVRDRLVEESVQRTFERHLGREILIKFATVYDASGSREKCFETPVRARIVATQVFDIIRWMDNDHIDPRWSVEILDAFGQLEPDDIIYDVYGFGWSSFKGFETKPCSEWSFAG